MNFRMLTFTSGFSLFGCQPVRGLLGRAKTWLTVKESTEVAQASVCSRERVVALCGGVDNPLNLGRAPMSDAGPKFTARRAPSPLRVLFKKRASDARLIPPMRTMRRGPRIVYELH